MLRYIQLLLLALLVSCGLYGQDNSLLYRISGNGLSQNSWLYGTMHWQDERLISFGPKVLDALEQSEAVAVEVVVGEDLQAQMGVLKYAFMDTTLSALLSKDDMDQVKQLLKEINPMFMLMVERLKPIFISTLITESRMEKTADYTVDGFFEKYGRALGKEIIGIETIEEQMQALDAISIEEQVQMLQEQLHSLDESDSSSAEMLRIYLSQDLDALYQFYQQQEDVTLNFDQALLQGRNKLMAHRMDSLMKIRPTFQAVGALHLPGENGVLQLLREQGYDVVAVPSPFATEPAELPAFTANYDWRELKVKEVKVQFPGKPEEKKIKTGDFKRKGYLYNDTANKLMFMMMHFEIEEPKVQNNGSGPWYDDLTKTLGQGKAFDIKLIAMDGQPGVQMQLTIMPGTVMFYHMTQLNGLVYLQMVMGEIYKVKSPAADKFFNSFEITAKAKK